MVFPAEAEPRAKRRALNLCQDHLRKVIDITRKITLLMDALMKNDKAAAKQLHEETQKLSDEVDNAKRMVGKELVEIGAILLNREDFLRFTDVTSEIADLCKGITFRVLAMMERKWDVPSDLKGGISELASAVFESVAKLRDTFFTLNYGSADLTEKAKDVELAERNVDNLYRELEIKILESNLNIHTVLLLRDIVQLLEDTADKIEDASDAVRILALTI